MAGEQNDLRDLLAHVPVSDAAKQDVVARMSASDRFYHNLDHLEALWRRHRAYRAAEGLQEPIVDMLLASAIAYHDCVYVAGRDDSEERSALHWLDAARASTLSESDQLWVADTIRATSDHLAYHPSPAFTGRSDPSAVLRERARVWLLDLDLTPMGEPAERFDSNTRKLRREASALSDDDWQAGLRVFFERLNNQPSLFRSRTLATAFEMQARHNVQRMCAG